MHFNKREAFFDDKSKRYRPIYLKDIDSNLFNLTPRLGCPEHYLKMDDFINTFMPNKKGIDYLQ